MKITIEPIEPTEEERKNGWTQKKLTEYVNERLNAPLESQETEIKVESYYNPYEW